MAVFLFSMVRERKNKAQNNGNNEYSSVKFPPKISNIYDVRTNQKEISAILSTNKACLGLDNPLRTLNIYIVRLLHFHLRR